MRRRQTPQLVLRSRPKQGTYFLAYPFFLPPFLTPLTCVASDSRKRAMHRQILTRYRNTDAYSARSLGELRLYFNTMLRCVTFDNSEGCWGAPW